MKGLMICHAMLWLAMRFEQKRPHSLNSYRRYEVQMIRGQSLPLIILAFILSNKNI